eukprot:scaffold4049_cov204-Alexandrium_tamarense.AAC.15
MAKIRSLTYKCRTVISGLHSDMANQTVSYPVILITRKIKMLKGKCDCQRPNTRVDEEIVQRNQRTNNSGTVLLIN